MRGVYIKKKFLEKFCIYEYENYYNGKAIGNDYGG